MTIKKVTLWASLALLLYTANAVPQTDLAIVEDIYPVQLVDVCGDEAVIWEVVYHHDRKLILQHAVTFHRSRPFWAGQRIPVTGNEQSEFYLIDYGRIDSVESPEILKDVDC